MVGDRSYDKEAARYNQIPFVGCKYGYGKPEELSDCKYSVETALELSRIIDEIIFNSPDLKKQYDLLIERIDVLEEIMNEESVGISTLKEAELNKLHERIGNYILKNYKKTEKIKIKKETKVIRKVKYLNEKRLEGFIYSVALEQQNSINKSIEEYYERMQNNLIV